jgi:ubiquinone/menaquinone biosynthesis C-methylase UbiE
VSTVRQDKIQHHYDVVAESYDDHYDRRKGRRYHSHISKYVISGLPKGGRLLDLGCGTGLFSKRYLAEGGSVAGLDISRMMISRARERCAAGDFSIANAEVIPFRDNSFDAVASLLVFTYLKEPATMLNEAYRVIKPGGAIAICTLGKKMVTRPIPALYQIGEKMNVKHVVMKDFGERYYDEEEMQALFSGAGFVDIRIKWCSFAHINMTDTIFDFAHKIEPFIEERVPQLAYNICVSAKKPEK